MKLPDDVRDLLVQLTDAGADFSVVGGHAVARQGTCVPPGPSTGWCGPTLTTRRA